MITHSTGTKSKTKLIDNQESKALHTDSIRASIVSLSKQELACWILAGWWALKWELDVGWVGSTDSEVNPK